MMTSVIIAEGGIQREVELDEYASVMSVLAILVAAGEAGEIASTVAHMFPDTKSIQRRNSHVNQILHRLQEHGHARRGDHEASPYYNSVRVYRWFVTPEGISFWKTGGTAARAAARQAQREARQQYLAQLEATRRTIRAALPGLVRAMPSGCMTARAELVEKLRKHYLTLDEIGAALGVTRERVRQYETYRNTRKCGCERCQQPAPALT